MPKINALPSVLWHYTDANGLWGIVNSRQLCFGDVRFLNDRTEKIYGERLLDQAFAAEAARRDTADVIAEIRTHMNMIGGPDRIYACSFSEAADSIGQWQRYGNDGSGYCIGFDRVRLEGILERDGVMRETMLYDEVEQRKHLRANIRKCVEYYRKDDTIFKQPNWQESVFTAGEVALTIVRLKSPHFQDERESRMIYFMNETDAESDDFEESFAVRGPYIKPFLLLPQPRKRKPLQLLPIVKIVCGPKLDAGLAIPAIDRFMLARGYAGVAIESSALTHVWR